MEKNLHFYNKLSFYLISASLFFWDIRYIPENLNINGNSLDKLLNYLELRFIYLICIIPIIFYIKNYLNSKILSKNFLIYSFAIFVFLLFHQFFTNINIFNIQELFYVILIFISLIIIKVYGMFFLKNKIVFIKFITFSSIFFYILSLFIFDFLNIKNNFGEELTWNKFNFEPCKKGFFNEFNFIFSESSHFGMVAISLFLTNFYYIFKTNFKDKSLVICFFIFSFILLNNISLTTIVGVIVCQIAIILANFRKENFKYITASILMIVIFIFVLLGFQSCKLKFNNATWLIKQKVPFLKMNLDKMTETFKKETINEYQGKKYKLKVNSKKEKAFEKEFVLTKSTDLSSAVLAHNLRVAHKSILSKPLGWGINRYEDAFEFYTKYEINEINHTYAIYVNNQDGSTNYVKIISEFGIFSLFLVLVYTIFIFSPRIDISDKIFLFPIIFVQVFLRGAGYFNGGFLITTLLIIFLILRAYERKV